MRTRPHSHSTGRLSGDSWARRARCLTGGVALVGLTTPPALSAWQSPDSVMAEVRSVALFVSPQVQAARAAVSAAEGRLAATGFGSAAVLSAEVEEVPGGFGFDGPIPVRLMLEKVFQPSGQADALRAVASADLVGALVRLDAVRRRVAAAADLAVIRTVGWAGLARRLEAEDGLLASAEASVRAQFSAGELGYGDVLRLRTERLRVQTSLSEAKAEETAARIELEGIFPPQDPAAAAPLAHLDTLALAPSMPFLLETLPALPRVDSLLDSAGAVRLAEADVREAVAQSEVVAALHRTQVGGYLGVERLRGDAGSVVYGPVAGLSVSLPFTARRAARTATASAQLDVESAEESLAATRATLRADLLAARARYQGAIERTSVLDADLLQAARAERESALASYRSGLIPLTDLLDFQRSLSLAEATQVRSAIAAAEALNELIALAYATGEAEPAASPATRRAGPPEGNRP